MKTIQELYNEIVGSQELKEKFIEAVNAGKQEAFLKEQGCGATLEEVAAFLKEKSEQDAPLSLDELDNAAGGTCNGKTYNEKVISIFSVGLGCAIVAINSAVNGHVGQEKGYEGRLCN